MSKEINNNFEKNNYSIQKNPEKEINKLAYIFLKKYSDKKSVIDKLMTFETSKGLEKFKKQLDTLKKEGKIEKKVKTEELFLAIKEAKNKISNSIKKDIETLKFSLNNKEFTPNPNYDLAEKIKDKNPKLYQKITNPQKLSEYFLSAGYGISNSIYKVGIGIKTLGIDFLKLLTFQVPLKQIKKQFKKV